MPYENLKQDDRAGVNESARTARYSTTSCPSNPVAHGDTGATVINDHDDEVMKVYDIAEWLKRRR